MMKREILAAAIVMVLCGIVRAEDKSASLRVVTYNIRYDNPGDGPNVWANRKGAMVEYLKSTKADLVGLQEVLPQQRDYLAGELTDYTAYSVGRDDGEKGEATPILFRKDRFELLDKGSFWLSTTPDKPGSKGWDAGLPRVVSWVKLQDKASGRPLLFVNTHFDNRGVEARLESAKLLVAKIAELDGAGKETLPVVLTGDFNCTAKQPPYAAIAGDEAGEAKLLDAQFISQKPHAGGDSTSNSFQELRPGAKIDFIFVRGLSVASHQIDDPRVEGRFVSDHQPVTAEVGW
jgi:endonuclease/exonuclease/phosphatase family metal-dependent hydrolase